VEAYKEFSKLTKEYVTVTENITDILRSDKKTDSDSKKNRTYTTKNITPK